MKTEQLQLDTRSELAVAIGDEAARAMDNILSLIEESPFTKPPVHNRHEAYGVAAEHYSKIAGCTKIIKKDCEDLLTTLPDPSLNAIEATSAIVNSINKSAVIILYYPCLDILERNIADHIHMGDEPESGAVSLAVGFKCPENVSVFVDGYVRQADRFHFLSQCLAEDELLRAARAVGTAAVRACRISGIPDKSFKCFHIPILLLFI